MKNWGGFHGVVVRGRVLSGTSGQATGALSPARVIRGLAPIGPGNNGFNENWGLIMLDREGFRPNVGIILLNQRNQVFWGKRIRTHSGNSRRAASSMARRRSRRCSESSTRKWASLNMCASSRTRDWRCATRCPSTTSAATHAGHYKGQKQIWFLLRLMGRDTDMNLRAPRIGVRRPALATTGAAGCGDRRSSAMSTRWR